MKNFILLCAIVCCANGCPATISNLHKRLHEISMKGPINLIVGGVDDDHYYRDAQIVYLSNQTRSCNNFPDFPIASFKQFCTPREGNPGYVLLTCRICLQNLYQWGVPLYSTLTLELTNHCHAWLLRDGILAVLLSTVHCMKTEKLSLQWEEGTKPLLKFWTILNQIQHGQQSLDFQQTMLVTSLAQQLWLLHLDKVPLSNLKNTSTNWLVKSMAVPGEFCLTN